MISGIGKVVAAGAGSVKDPKHRHSGPRTNISNDNYCSPTTLAVHSFDKSLQKTFEHVHVYRQRRSDILYHQERSHYTNNCGCYAIRMREVLLSSYARYFFLIAEEYMNSSVSDVIVLTSMPPLR